MTDSELNASSIDVYSSKAYVDGIPHAQFSWLRDNVPVFKHEHPDGGFYWVLSRHADVMAVSRDHKTFSAQKGFVMVDDMEPEILEQVQGQLLGMDPPNHGPIRRAVITRFTSKMLAELEPKIRAITQQIMRDARSLSETDFVETLAGELPTSVIGSMLGVPRDQWPKLREWSDKMTAGNDPDLGGSREEVIQASTDMGMLGYQLACERKDKGGSDLISLLINVEVDGKLVSEMDFASLFIQITTAGNETTRGLISAGMLQLIQQPELYQELLESPELLPSAIEEMLRWTCPLHYFRRTATQDCEIAGQAISEGDRVVMLYSSANFDDRVFDKPMQFDIHRSPNPHTAFGHGIHLCLGANLARMEARIFFEEFFKAFENIELIGDLARVESNSINALKRMPVRLTARDDYLC